MRRTAENHEKPSSVRLFHVARGAVSEVVALQNALPRVIDQPPRLHDSVQQAQWITSTAAIIAGIGSKTPLTNNARCLMRKCGKFGNFGHDLRLLNSAAPHGALRMLLRKAFIFAERYGGGWDQWRGRRHTAEEIVAKLRQVDVLMAQGGLVAAAVVPILSGTSAPVDRVQRAPDGRSFLSIRLFFVCCPTSPGDQPTGRRSNVMPSPYRLMCRLITHGPPCFERLSDRPCKVARRKAIQLNMAPGRERFRAQTARGLASICNRGYDIH